jgi:hypothetical protein
MLRKMKMDPLRIHNYNKFLITLDKTSTNKVEKTTTTKVEEEEKPIKPNVDTIINNITIDYYLNGHSTSSFTGENTTLDMDIDDPNEYKSKINEKKELIVGKLFKPYARKMDPYIDSEVKVKIKENPIYIKIKDFVNIETEINNIDDIIKLTEKYKLDPEIEYNVNMKALHNIKEPLQELNNMIGMSELKNNIVYAYSNLRTARHW